MERVAPSWPLWAKLRDHLWANRWANLAARLGAGLALVALGAGCAPAVGDPCTTSIDCSQLGDRLCDTSQPDGYCTIFNCEPDTCPEDSVCVGFALKLDPVCGENEDPRWSRFERTFCMATCESDEDCREGYLCASPEERNGVSIDTKSEDKDSKACFPEGEVRAATGQSTDVPATCEP